MDCVEPTTYHEARVDPHLVDAMTKEATTLQQNGTWEFVTLPKDKKTIGCKWVYIIKKHVHGSIERYKIWS